MKTLNISDLDRKYFLSVEETKTAFYNNENRANWFLKRIILHIVWGTLNIVSLVSLFNLISDTKLVLVFIVLGLVYCFSYWIITSILFDKLIGDEIDALSK